MKVLIVDDHPIVLSGCRALLAEADDMEMLEARDATSAQEMHSAQRPDVTVIDINLPDVSGFEVCEHIRASAHLKDTPVLMISARTLAVDRAQAEEAGATGYLIKPFTPEEFRQQVERVMASRPRKEAQS